eukprot:TRINITY_DN396_c3_g1_i1.p1 TRINITY_DN396_c3_g1~~TRINITY_DN396_c3_g1_i1.p1  ORF type:complete len:1265 (-),score=516.92 TRINITY_DN396_c3_g1_i1:222-4016(-)
MTSNATPRSGKSRSGKKFSPTQQYENKITELFNNVAVEAKQTSKKRNVEAKRVIDSGHWGQVNLTYPKVISATGSKTFAEVLERQNKVWGTSFKPDHFELDQQQFFEFVHAILAVTSKKKSSSVLQSPTSGAANAKSQELVNLYEAAELAHVEEELKKVQQATTASPSASSSSSASSDSSSSSSSSSLSSSTPLEQAPSTPSAVAKTEDDSNSESKKPLREWNSSTRTKEEKTAKSSTEEAHRRMSAVTAKDILHPSRRASGPRKKLSVKPAAEEKKVHTANTVQPLSSTLLVSPRRSAQRSGEDAGIDNVLLEKFTGAPEPRPLPKNNNSYSASNTPRGSLPKSPRLSQTMSARTSFVTTASPRRSSSVKRSTLSSPSSARGRPSSTRHSLSPPSHTPSSGSPRSSHASPALKHHEQSSSPSQQQPQHSSPHTATIQTFTPPTAIASSTSMSSSAEASLVLRQPQVSEDANFDDEPSTTSATTSSSSPSAVSTSQQASSVPTSSSLFMTLSPSSSSSSSSSSSLSATLLTTAETRTPSQPAPVMHTITFVNGKMETKVSSSSQPPVTHLSAQESLKKFAESDNDNDIDQAMGDFVPSSNIPSHLISTVTASSLSSSSSSASAPVTAMMTTISSSGAMHTIQNNNNNNNNNNAKTNDEEKAVPAPSLASESESAAELSDQPVVLASSLFQPMTGALDLSSIASSTKSRSAKGVHFSGEQTQISNTGSPYQTQLAVLGSAPHTPSPRTKPTTSSRKGTPHPKSAGHKAGDVLKKERTPKNKNPASPRKSAGSSPHTPREKKDKDTTAATTAPTTTAATISVDDATDYRTMCEELKKQLQRKTEEVKIKEEEVKSVTQSAENWGRNLKTRYDAAMQTAERLIAESQSKEALRQALKNQIVAAEPQEQSSELARSKFAVGSLLLELQEVIASVPSSSTSSSSSATGASSQESGINKDDPVSADRLHLMADALKQLQTRLINATSPSTSVSTAPSSSSSLASSESSSVAAVTSDSSSSSSSSSVAPHTQTPEQLAKRQDELNEKQQKITSQIEHLESARTSQLVAKNELEETLQSVQAIQKARTEFELECAKTASGLAEGFKKEIKEAYEAQRQRDLQRLKDLKEAEEIQRKREEELIQELKQAEEAKRLREIETAAKLKEMRAQLEAKMKQLEEKEERALTCSSSITTSTNTTPSSIRYVHFDPSLMQEHGCVRQLRIWIMVILLVVIAVVVADIVFPTSRGSRFRLSSLFSNPDPWSDDDSSAPLL